MPTYEYETIPAAPGQRVRRFELYQPITASALTTDPETGAAVRRVISGGLGIFIDASPASDVPPCFSGASDPSESCAQPQMGCQGGRCALR
ncbi:MAG: zinc ribbon domain-containing protein [Planctomycetota bacterium]